MVVGGGCLRVPGLAALKFSERARIMGRGGDLMDCWTSSILHRSKSRTCYKKRQAIHKLSLVHLPRLGQNLQFISGINADAISPWPQPLLGEFGKCPSPGVYRHKTCTQI